MYIPISQLSSIELSNQVLAHWIQIIMCSSLRQTARFSSLVRLKAATSSKSKA